jgi:protein TonB
MREAPLRLLAALLVSIGVHAAAFGGVALLAGRGAFAAARPPAHAGGTEGGGAAAMSVRLGSPRDTTRQPVERRQELARASVPTGGDPAASRPARPAAEGSGSGGAATGKAPPAGADAPGGAGTTEASAEASAGAPGAGGRRATPGSASAPATVPVSAVPPRLAAPLEPRYPRAARRAGAEGVTRVRVEVARSGRIEAVELHRTSGNGHLDAAALRAVRRARFSPALRGGEAAAGSLIVAVEFRLE